MAVALAERLRKAAAPWEPAGNDTHYLALAREALAFARDLLPTREEAGRALFDEVQRQQNDVTAWDDPIILEATRESYRQEADAILRDLRARLGEKG
jgi:hypothetical protein